MCYEYTAEPYTLSVIRLTQTSFPRKAEGSDPCNQNTLVHALSSTPLIRPSWPSVLCE